MDGVCRTCMSSKKPVKSLFEVDSDLIELHVKLYTCFPTFNFDDSDFPKTMCEPCIKKLQSAYKFRELCLKSTSVFLKKRKNKNNIKKGAAKPDLELNTKNEKTLELVAPHTISTPNISEQIELCPTPNKLNTLDTTEPHLSVPLTNNLDNELNTKNKLEDNEKNIALQSISVDSASNETSESAETINTLNDERTNKVHTLDSVQTENSFKVKRLSVEKEIIDENSEQDKHNSISTTTSVQYDTDTNIAKDTEVQGENNDKSSKDFFIYQDSNSVDILVNNQVYRINLIDGNESSLKCQKINQLLNEIEKTRSEENNNAYTEVTDTENEICFEQTIENDTENNFSFIREHKNQSKQNTEIMNDETETNVPEKDTHTSDDETSLLKPLENYHLNNFITSSLAYKGEQQLEQTKFEDETDVKVIITDSAIRETISEQENYFDVAANEIELPTNLPEENIHPIFELKIECVRTLSEEDKNMATVEKLDFEGNPTKSFVNNKPFLTPVPIAKLLNCNQNSVYEPDEIDDLVNQNVTEVFDYSNHNDHTYAKMLGTETVPRALPINYVKRKRKIPAKFKMSEELELNRPKLKELKQNLKEIKSCLNSKGQTNVIPSKPVTIIKRRRRRRVNKVTNVLTETTETDTSSNLVLSSDVPPESIINNTIFTDVYPQKINENMVMRVPLKRIVDDTISDVFSKNVTKNTLDTDEDVLAKNILENLPDMDVPPKNIVNTKLSLKSRVKRSYGTRANFIPYVNSNTNEYEKKVEWKVKKVRSEKNGIHPFRLRLKNMAVKTKISTKEYVKVKSKETKPKGNVDKAKKSKLKEKTNSKTEIPVPKHIQEEKTINEIKAEPVKIPEETNHTIETSIEKETEKELPSKKSKIEPQIINKNETSTSTDFTSMTLNENEVRIDEDLKYPYECDLCSYRTNIMTKLEEHLATHLDGKTKSLTCKYCTKSFSNIVGYKIHQTRVHKNQVSESQESFHTCKICNKVFSSVKNWSKHKKIHKLQK